MSLTTILYTGRSSLLAHQNAIGTASNNTANADVAGFSKRDSILRSSRFGVGVSYEGANRRANVWLQRRVLLERSQLGTASAQTNSLASLDAMVSANDSGIGGSIDRFFSAVRTLAAAPADTQGRRDLIAQAENLRDAFNSTSIRLSMERQQADGILAADVERTNILLQDVANLNRRLTAEESSGTEASELRDERDRVLSELAEMVEITTLEDSDGQTTVLLSGGSTLVSKDQAASFQAEPDPALDGFRRVDLVEISGLASDITSELRRGRLGGSLELRDDTIGAMSARVDQLAFDLATEFNNIHQAGFGTDGVSGRDFFDLPATPDGAASTLDLVAGLTANPDWIAASDTAAAASGSNVNLLALSSLSNDPLAAGGSTTFADEYASIVGDVGRAVSGNRASHERAQMQVAQAEAVKESQTGVSVDEELIDITRYQRSYQAATRVISVVDQMYDTLLQL